MFRLRTSAPIAKGLKQSIYQRSVARPAFSVRYFSEKPEAGKAEEATEATESGEEAAVDPWQAKYEAKDKELAQLKGKYLRSVADFRNLQETMNREVKKAKDYALQKFAKDLLESVDNLDRALSVVDKETVNKEEGDKTLSTFHEGVELVQNVFEKTLARHGLVKLNPLGEKFDPNVHEATFEVPQPDKEPGTIFHVQQSGFSLNDRVIRAPKVGVVKGE